MKDYFKYFLHSLRILKSVSGSKLILGGHEPKTFETENMGLRRLSLLLNTATLQKF